MDLHHLPEGTHCLANRPGSLDQLTFHIGADVRSGELAVEPPVSLSPDQNHQRSIPVQAKLVGVGRFALPRLFEFESNRSAIPDEPHAGSATREWTSQVLPDGFPKQAGSLSRTAKHPEGSAILSRRGLLFPLKPVAAKWWA